MPGTAALASPCGYASWYTPGKILVSTTTFPAGSDAGILIPSTLLDINSGETSGVGIPGLTSLSVVMSAQSADGRYAAVAADRRLETGALAGGKRQQLGVASAAIVSVSWAHPTGGVANLVAPPKPPATALGLAGAPSIDSRFGGTDCRTGRWVNRTPSPLPAGWPAPRRDSSAAFDSDRGTLRVEGGYTQTAPSTLSMLPIPDTQTMEWNGADGRWTNLTRPDGFGPIGERAMAYDPQRKVVLAMGAPLPGDGPWTWTPMRAGRTCVHRRLACCGRGQAVAPSLSTMSRAIAGWYRVEAPHRPPGNGTALPGRRASYRRLAPPRPVRRALAAVFSPPRST